MFARKLMLILAAPALALPILFTSANDAAGTTTPSSNPLAKTLAAHGGISRWQQQRTFSYRLNGFPLSPQAAKPNTSTVDLLHRRNRIVGEGFTVGFDGKEAWATPTAKAAGLPARFFSLGSFYFIGMPFVFADAGVHVEELPQASFRGKEYRVLRATYARGVGYTPDDDYVLYVHRDTGVLKLIHHAVTEPSNRVKRVTWVFDEWQQVQGLQVPKTMTFYPGWNEGRDPGKGASFTVEEVRFSTEAPDASIYARPAGAVVDDSPYDNQ